MNPILCIHSLTAHGCVGLKAFIATLGENCLPVPSLLLTGPGDMPGCQRFEYAFESMLRGTLEAAATRGARLTVFVGYLAHAGQVPVILRALDDFPSAVASLWVDPVSGDHGRAYVSEALIAAWPLLLNRAEWAFPNATEAGLLTGQVSDESAAGTTLRKKFSDLNIVVTGQLRGNELETRLLRPGLVDHAHRQPLIPGRFNGTGDLFAATFARSRLIEKQTPEIALSSAARSVAESIERGQQRGVAGLGLR
jgi:pyridoxal/pyridoxine/pyridoxamine kinase